jgi:NitT/TauT family transport system ATP-binding protein
MYFHRNDTSADFYRPTMIKTHGNIPDASVSPSIRLSNVIQSFAGPRGDFVAVNDVTFETSPGEFLVIVGPSGCGKSTLLSLISGLAFPKGGTVEVLGKQVTKLQRDLGFIFQRDALLPWRTALQNVALPLRFRGLSKSAANERALSWLTRTGLKKFETSYPHQLSGGMRKRVAIAATLAYEPRILLMDEPFSALDVETRTIMENDLLELWGLSKPTVVFITHDLQEAIGLADRVLVLTAGPGRVLGNYKIDLPRPRNLMELRFDPKFIEIQHNIWNDLRGEVLKAYQQQ